VTVVGRRHCSGACPMLLLGVYALSDGHAACGMVCMFVLIVACENTCTRAGPDKVAGEGEGAPLMPLLT
jgi:hypothetical protein